MRDDLSDLRDFLRDEGIADGAVLRQAEEDPALAEAGERALAGVLGRDLARRRRRRAAGGLAVAAVTVVLAVGAGEALFRPVPPAAPAASGSSASPSPSPSPDAEEVALAPLRFRPAPAGSALDDVTEASGRASGYGGSVPAPTSWYEWSAAAPQHGRLVVVTPRDGRSVVETWDVQPPQGGRIDVADRARPDSVTAVERAPSADGAAAEALRAAAAAGCATDPSTCAAASGSPLSSAANVPSSAALRALVALPAVRTAGVTTDRLGRPAIGFSVELAEQTIVVLADPETGAFLGAEWTDQQPSPHVTRMVVALPDPQADGT